MQKKYRAAVLAFLAALLLVGHLGARLARAVPAFSFAAEQKCIYLTFDDGPSTVVTNRVLDILAEENVKATFFIVGAQIDGREETLRRAVAEGHTLGVHSETHRYPLIYASDRALLDDIRSCAEHIRAVTGVTPRVYRFPGGGVHRTAQRKLVEREGYRIVDWNAGCGDEEIAGADAARLLEEAKRTSAGKNRVVFLSHDSPHHKETAAALPQIIAYFREQGYEFRAF